MTGRRVLTVAVIATVMGLIVFVRLYPAHGPTVDITRARQASCTAVAHAFAARHSRLWLTFAGTVVRTLPDSHGHFIHQRFVVSCPSGQTILVVNDVILGQRAPVSPGEHVAVRGEYVWNELGGLVHFTHHDPSGGAENGWIVVGGRAYAFRLFLVGPYGMAPHDPISPRSLQGDFV